MKCLVLKGHERPITAVKYNREGDLLFTVSKDKEVAVNVWYTDNGERLGSYQGHVGAVWAIDVDYMSTRIITGSGDNTIKLWELKTGKDLCTWKFKSGVRTVNFSLGDKMFLAGTDATMSQQPTLFVFKVPDETSNISKDQVVEDKPILTILGHEKKINSAFWGPLNKTIITCSDDKSIRQWDTETGKQLAIAHHAKEVNKIQPSYDGNSFISASFDFTSKLWDTRTLACIKTFDTSRPVNDAAISPLMDHVIMGGGQSAASVTQTQSRSSQFQVRFFHKIFQNEIGTVKGHFGPVNALAFGPDGKSFVSGGEDGYVRLHHFDSAYFKMKE